MFDPDFFLIFTTIHVNFKKFMYKKLSLMILGMALVFGAFATGHEPKPVPPNEGMWLPHLVRAMNIDEMQKLGCELSAEEIYSVNKSSIKDAVVQLGGFCTAEVVSGSGLLFTNHHCAYDAIATHSTQEDDYLTDGFWASNQGEEIHTPGLTVSFLVRIEDVTKEIAEAGPEGRRDAETRLVAEATEGTSYRANIRDMFKGNQQLLFVYETFRDVRLVGAPPSAIGKFGGDTDNWMWPRHTGDFAVLRVYAGADNKPADYSPDNRPYKPKHYLPISLKGVQEGDFAMTLGFPGSTDRYLTSSAIKHTYEVANPSVVKILGERLRIMKGFMDADDQIRIDLASEYASLSNYHKYCIGQNRGLARRGLIEERVDFEKKFQQWATADSDRKEKYGEILEQIKRNYEASADILKLRSYVNMAGFGPGFVAYGLQYFRAKRALDADNQEAADAAFGRLEEGLDDHFAEYFANVDEKVAAAMIRMMYNDLPKEMHPSVFESKNFTKAKAKGDMDRFDAYAAKIFDKSFLTDKGRAASFLSDPNVKDMAKDPGFEYVNSLIELFISKLQMEGGMFDQVDEQAMMVYEAGMMEMMKDKNFYPDANSTMRLSYGKVIPYDPRDGVSYKYQTYGEGILEKEVPGDEEFDVPEKLHRLLKAKDFGPYGENGRLPLCVLTDNDITGGNSGSPLINGKGELIGIAFDGNWESMTSDLVFDDAIVRTISVDARYVLFVIDKYANCQYIMKELSVKK